MSAAVALQCGSPHVDRPILATVMTTGGREELQRIRPGPTLLRSHNSRQMAGFRVAPDEVSASRSPSDFWSGTCLRRALPCRRSAQSGGPAAGAACRFRRGTHRERDRISEGLASIRMEILASAAARLVRKPSRQYGTGAVLRVLPFHFKTPTCANDSQLPRKAEESVRFWRGRWKVWQDKPSRARGDIRRQVFVCTLV